MAFPFDNLGKEVSIQICTIKDIENLVINASNGATLILISVTVSSYFENCTCLKHPLLMLPMIRTTYSDSVSTRM